ncbi:MAG: hypothetical protein IT177_03580 [Acidobacteria bacterium]|nr:hypothetical protein [Acidobacteriota bacterium]
MNGLYEVEQTIPERLPLLDAFVEERIGDQQPLAGLTTVLIQHQLGSLVPLTRALLQLGADPARLYCIDIPYTANQAVQAELLRLGIPESNFAPSYYHLEMPYASYQRFRVEDMAVRLAKSLAPSDRFLVFDDGSYCLEALSCFATKVPTLNVVEQTTRGIIKINGDAALREYCETVRVMNVAQSGPKGTLEAPFIGHAVTRALMDRLAGEFEQLRQARCLVLGFGQIGKNVAAALVAHGIPRASVHVMDPSPDAQALAAAKGFTVWDRRFPEKRRFRLVVGCSGTTSFGIGDRAFLEDGAILASASSGSAELSREAFIELADTHPSHDIYVVDRDTLSSRSIHSDITIRLVDREARFLNGGFPVNFDGQVNSVPPRFIQATHALQLGAAIEAVADDTRGLIDLSEGLCAWVERRYRELLGAEVRFIDGDGGA